MGANTSSVIAQTPSWVERRAANPNLDWRAEVQAAANESDARTKKGAALLFLIDCTGSMGQWITAINELLPALVHSVAITDLFQTMAVLEYSDYDLPVDQVVRFSGWQRTSVTADVTALAEFAKTMKPRGGGGAPEAFKSALYRLAADASQLSDYAKVHVLHLTDAPPHFGSDLDGEGKKERDALGADRFAWPSVVFQLLTSIPTLRFTALVSTNHVAYCDLAARTGGSVHSLRGAAAAATIRKDIGAIINGWLGLPDAHPTQQRSRGSMEFDDAPPEELALSTRLRAVDVVMDAAMPWCPVLKPRLSEAVKRMRKDGEFRERLIATLTTILEVDPMALTVSPVVGKLWREMCKLRHDARRDELIERLSKRKATLPAVERATLEEWLKESYNACSEINEQLLAFMKANETTGLLRFVPESEELCAQQVVQLLARNDKNSTAIIRAILSRMLVDRTATIPKVAAKAAPARHVDPTAAAVADDSSDSDDDGEAADLPPLQAGTLPLNLPAEELMMLTMHTVAPGTKLSRRYAALLAMHAILCGSVLSDVAKAYLSKIKGRWINWKRRTDDVAEVPENFAPAFVAMLVDPCLVELTVTEEELKFAKFVLKVASALRFYHSVEVGVEMLDMTSADGKFPDHMVLCTKCAKNRPLSLITESGECAYCIEERGAAVPEWDAESSLQVRCFTCGAFYGRDPAVRITQGSKCHGCHHADAPSPSVECRVCHARVVQYFNREAGLPKHGACGPCAAGRAPRRLLNKEYPGLLHQLIDQSAGFTRLCAAVGLAPVTGDVINLNSKGVYDAVLLLREMEGPTAAAPTTAEVPVTFRNGVPENAQAILDEALKVMQGVRGTHREVECAVCLSTEARLGPACGRKGCDQRVCRDCAVAWYGKNEPGKKLYERAMLCQFCARTPAPNVLRAVSARIVAMSMANRGRVLEATAFHAWCEGCDMAVPVGNRDCAELLGGGNAGLDQLERFRCPGCVQRAERRAAGDDAAPVTAVDDLGDCRECPNCTVMIHREYGCDHMTCDCGQHFCWRCGAQFDNADDTYEHMYTAHVDAEED